MNRSLSQKTILAADVGGTKTNLAILEVVNSPKGETFKVVRQQRFHSQKYPSINAILREFLGQDKVDILSACFGIPGAVHNQKVKPVNLSWVVDAADIKNEFGFGSVLLINDLMANACGTLELQPTDFEQLNPSEMALPGNRAICSPGTGLGEAGLYWNGKEHLPWATEGGHVDFAPRNATEIALLEFLLKEFHHVSYERILCGKGLENVYRFLRDTGRAGESTIVVQEMAIQDPAAVISEHGLAGDCDLCVKALDLFVQILGAEAGNLALKFMAIGGIYLGGGIPIKILPKLRSPLFLQAFSDKGRLSEIVKAIPVYVVLHDDAAMLGAARQALISAC